MRSCIQIETASLVFASLSLLVTSLGSLMCIAMLVHVNILTVNLVFGAEEKLSREYVENITTYDIYIHAILTCFLSVLAVTFAFTIILTKGLISRKAHLVKAYFVYGVTMNTISVISHVSMFTNFPFANFITLWTLCVCFLYSLILWMIKKTYVKFSNTESNQFAHKKLEEEKCNA